MFAESHRPMVLDDLIGHTEIKRLLRTHLEAPPKCSSILVSGTPGIGKTTLVLAAARTCGYEPLEINASRSLRSHDDVTRLRDSCMAPVSFTSLATGQRNRKTCVILDEVDGSDPHAQRKILDWIKDPARVVPILCTANEVPVIFKRASEHVHIHRCMPLNAQTLYDALKDKCRGIAYPEFQVLVKDCQFDVRRILHRVQYGISDKPRIVTMTADIITDLRQQEKTFYKSTPIEQGLESTET